MTNQGYTAAGQVLQKQQAASPVNLVQKHRAFLDARMGALAKWVTQGVRPEALIRFALLDLNQNEKLRQCTPESIYLGLLACAVTGLEPGALRGEAYLVPFKSTATFMPGWRGLVKQARRSRDVVGITANVVRESDFFDLDLGSNTIVHKPLLRGERGNVIGAWARATMRDGDSEIEWMDAEDLGAIQRVAESRGKSPAWRDWPDQMQRKSPIRRLAKRLPLGADYYVGLALEQAHEDGDATQVRNVLDTVTDGEATKSEQSAEAAARMTPHHAETTDEITPEEAEEIRRREAEEQ